MARKNIFGIENPAQKVSEIEPVVDTDARPLANFERPLRRSGPVGAFSQSLGNMSEKAQRAADLERQLADGQAIVELNPSLIDSSFVPDRLGIDMADLDILVGQIREHGQQVPILVRPHPETDGRYQVAYGHRRLAALKKLSGMVKAVIRPLTDEQLVVSQGQENNARTDLSFVERSFFALRLERRGFSRDIIMSSLGVDKAALSRMIALAMRMPDLLIEAIGPAPGFGRTRWAELADLLENEDTKSKALKIAETKAFQDRNSDDRFDYLYNQLRQSKAKPRVHAWKAGNLRAVKITETEDNLVLNFDKIALPQFGVFVEQRLGALHEEFLDWKKRGE